MVHKKNRLLDANLKQSGFRSEKNQDAEKEEKSDKKKCYRHSITNGV